MIAPGITSYSTPRHGGINLSAERLAEMPAALRSVHPFAGPGWYEEDQDWAIVVLAFPLFFPGAHVSAAVDTARHAPSSSEPMHYFAPVKAWIESEEAEPVHAIVEAWKREHGHLYRKVSTGSVPRRLQAIAAQFAPTDPFSRRYLSWVALRRISDGQPAEALLFNEEAYGQIDGIDLAAIDPARVFLAQPAEA